MKILLIHDIGYEIGGAEGILISLKRELTSRGHTVKVLTSANPQNTFADYTYLSPDINPFFKGIFYLFNPFAYSKIMQILSKFKPDVIHVHTFTKASPSILLAIKNLPHVVTAHDYGIIFPFLKNYINDSSIHRFKDLGACCYKHSGFRYIWELLRCKLIQFVISGKSVICTPSHYMKEIFSKHFNNRIEAIHNGIELFPPTPLKYESNVLFVGRLVEEKGIFILLEAIKELSKNLKSVKLAIIGSGELEQKIKKYIIENNLHKYIDNPIKVVHKSIFEYYKNCSVTVIPSIWPEPFSLVGIESMSVGRPVIASRVGGIPEWLVDNKVGYLFNPGDVKVLTEQLRNLLADKNLLHSMSLNSIKEAKNYNLQKFIKEHEILYKSLVN